MDAEFLHSVEELRVPIMGSESVAPLLYTLVRFTRPRRVLEVGSGYTTAFIARALADNAADFQQARPFVAAKARDFLRVQPNLQQQKAWYKTEPPFASPLFYTSPYKPIFVAVDSLAIASSSASQVSSILDRVGLGGIVTMLNGDLRQLHERVVQHCAPIDFAWVDCDQSITVFEQYWPDMNPADGVLLFHWLLTDRNGEAVLEYFKSKQRIRNDFEIVSLWEPHKIAQNSITIIRKTARKNPVFGDGSALLNGARELLKSNS
jgi:predicted O-methyltransferase YrrM